MKWSRRNRRVTLRWVFAMLLMGGIVAGCSDEGNGGYDGTYSPHVNPADTKQVRMTCDVIDPSNVLPEGVK